MRRDKRGEQLYFFFGEHGLEWDAAGGRRVVGEDPSSRCRTVYATLALTRVMREKGNALQGYLLLQESGVDAQLVCSRHSTS